MRRLLLVLAVAAAMVGTSAVAVGATAPTESGIVNLIPDVFDPTPTDFTATGGVVCSEGTVENVFFKAAGGGPTGVNFQVVKKFSCDDGEFFVKLQVRLSFDTFTTTFNWNVVGGTGAYADLHGSGNGFSELCGVDCIIDNYEGGFHIDPVTS
jgi:hypothetical protein